MSFPVNSTTVGTAATKRIERVLQRAKVGSGKTRIIAYAGRFVCKRISGSSSWSQHSWGNADDLFPTQGGLTSKKCADISMAVVYLATHRVKTNAFRRLPVAEVIDHLNRRIWTPAGGWKTYGGTVGPHVHVTGAPVRLGTPACA